VRVPGLGWIAPILDPHDKIVFVAADPQPYPTSPGVGEISWDRLYTADPEAAADYYTGVLPWTLVRHADGSPGGLRTAEDATVADLVPAGDGPPHWLPYVHVADLDAARDRAVGLGGSVLVEREAFPGDSGLGAVIIDPQGVATGLCQPTRTVRS
jgi:predicted enzyme related to lactoylglutathione lyase